VAHGVIEVLPRIRRLSRKYACGSALAEDLESIATLAVIEAIPKFREDRGEWESFATKVAQNAILDELRAADTRGAAHVLIDALSASLTVALLARSHRLGGSPAFQDESAYVDQIMSRLETNALGKMLFAESLNGRVSCMAFSRQRRRAKSRWAYARALKDAKEQAAKLVSED
jgi:DNA-directed RNA polymerase specialized sigma24 family protein